MWEKQRPSHHLTSARLKVFFPAFSLAFCLAFVASAQVPEAAGTAGAQLQPVESSPAAKRPLGPPVTDFKTDGFTISKVVRMERSLNALGIAAQFGKTSKVGKYVELPKRLESSERGEHFLVTWKYSAKSASRSATLTLEYKLSEEEHLETITKDYSNPKKGTYRLRVENTGDSYRRRGHIEYWRVSILADGELVARKESFLWPVFRAEKPAQAEPGA